MAAEIRDKRVVIVPKGAWDKEDTLTLNVDAANAGGASFLWKNAGSTVQAPVTTIDRIVSDLRLDKVSLIKMHVEGAEQSTLSGAAGTIRRFHPRLAIVLEHHVDDVNVLPVMARQIWPGYHVELTPCTKTMNRIHPGAALLVP
jgi:FkbM family methyltransferase